MCSIICALWTSYIKISLVPWCVAPKPAPNAVDTTFSPFRQALEHCERPLRLAKASKQYRVCPHLPGGHVDVVVVVGCHHVGTDVGVSQLCGHRCRETHRLQAGVHRQGDPTEGTWAPTTSHLYRWWQAFMHQLVLPRHLLHHMSRPLESLQRARKRLGVEGSTRFGGVGMGDSMLVQP